jgi:phosphoglycolate phosphatase-like HAD superfamily hydrolase
MEAKHCVICDIDGTLANLDHRLHHIKKEPKDWDSFFDKLGQDEPVEEVVVLVHALSEYDFPIVICSGRQEKYREATEAWLDKHDICWDALYLRQTGDFRPDEVIKTELLFKMRNEGWNPSFVIDDRQKVVDEWRNQGLVCFQCAPGDFDVPKP